jgi:hypothetical protein
MRKLKNSLMNSLKNSKMNLKYTISEACMPIDEEEVYDIYNEFIKKGIKDLAIKLYDTASVSVVIEVKKLYLKNMKEEFKDLKKRNYNASMRFNYDLCQKLSKSLKIPKIETVSDIPPTFLNIYYEEYLKLYTEYQKGSKGPAKTEAFCKFFEIDFSNAHQSLLQDIDLAFRENINNIQIQISELAASEQKWTSIISNLKNSIESNEESKTKLNEEKNKLEHDLDVLQRKINDSTSEQNKKVELRVLELNNSQKLLETKISEKQGTINDLKKEIEEYEALLQNNKDQFLSLQREKIKEISSR